MSDTIQKTKQPFQTAFLHPKYAGVWLTAGIFRSLVYLPLPIQLKIGKQIGRLCLKTLKSRRHTTEVNVRLCFPEKTQKEQAELVQQVFENAGAGLMESLCAWWNPKKFKGLVSVQGLEQIKASKAKNRAVLLLGLHSTMLDLGGLLASYFLEICTVYRPQDKPILDWFVFNGRIHLTHKQIPKKIQSMVQSLQNKETLWYAPDQDYGLKYGVMSKFFGIPAASITAGRRLAKDNDADVFAIYFFRTTPLSGKGSWIKPQYKVIFTEKIENYPTTDEQADADRINQLLETLIKHDIAQYMWFHRRFKTQADSTDYYAK